MQQQSLNYESSRRQHGHVLRRAVWIWTSVAAAISLVICAASVIAQLREWGTRLIVSGPYYAPEYVYSVVIGRHAFYYAYIFSATWWLPALWVIVAVPVCVLRLLHNPPMQRTGRSQNTMHS
jgi:4-hydroxybenzoate polyprenyltransferase